MTQDEILYGYNVILEITDVNIFEYIKDHKDDFLWERRFRPAFSEKKYIKHDERSRINLTPISTFHVKIEPQNQSDAEQLLKDIRSLINDIANFIVQDGTFDLREVDLNYVLIFYQNLNLKTLLPEWYSSVVEVSKIQLQEFQTFVEDRDKDIVRKTEVTLSKVDKDRLKIRISSPDLSLAEQLVESITESSAE